MNLKYNIHIRDRHRTIAAIDNFTIPQNEVTFLFGESGIGKSMISKAIYGLLDPDELQISINSKNYQDYLNEALTKEIKKNSFFVFQEPSSHLNPLLKLKKQLTEGSLIHAKNEQEILSRLWNTTNDSSIKKILNIYPKPYRPSGGEKQRILLAMAFKKINVLLNQNNPSLPTFFVFDEPTGSLDNNYRNLFLSILFEKYRQKPFTTLIITHDYSIISEVYRKYPHLLERIHFMELVRKDEASVSLNDFCAEEYLNWLNRARRKTHDLQEIKSSQNKELLKLDNGFEVFGRRFSIYKDAGHTMPAPLVIRRGELIYLKAASGVGKTTLAKIVMGLIPAKKLRLNLSGFRITEKKNKKFWQKRIWGKKASLVFQHADEALNLNAGVKDIFAGLKTSKKLTANILKFKLKELFDNGVSDSFLNKKTAFLSGGQKQRLNLLRALILDADLIILDEPLNGLDFNSIKKILAILEKKRMEGKGLLMISHNEEIFDSVVDEDHVYYLNYV